MSALILKSLGYNKLEKSVTVSMKSQLWLSTIKNKNPTIKTQQCSLCKEYVQNDEKIILMLSLQRNIKNLF